MKITHRISLSVDKKIKKTLSSIGIEIEFGFVSFEIDEDNSGWLKLEPLIQEWQAVDIIKTKFTKSELDKVKYLKLSANWHWGYPQPDDDFGYLNESYDLSKYSSISGIGKVQKAPIRIKGEPKWGKKNILQLNWLFDIFFVQPDIWKSVFKSFKIEAMPVIDHKKNTALKTILQLVPQGMVELNLTGYPKEICPDTGIEKYSPITKGYFPSIDGENDLDFAQSKEFFGSGHSAFRATIISASLYRKLVENKIKGISFTPLQP
jgi:hypothetical protein